MASLFHDGGFPYLVMENIRNRIIPSYYNIFETSRKFIYLGDREDDLKRKLSNHKPILKYLTGKFHAYNFQVVDYFDKDKYHETLEDYFYYYYHRHPIELENGRIDRHGYIASLNLLKMFDVLVLNKDLGRDDFEEIDMIVRTASEAIFTHDQRLANNKKFILDKNPVCLLLNIVDDIARVGRIRLKEEKDIEYEIKMVSHKYTPIIDYKRIDISFSNNHLPTYEITFTKNKDSDDDTDFSKEEKNLLDRLNLKWNGDEAFTIKYRMKKERGARKKAKSDESK